MPLARIARVGRLVRVAGVARLAGLTRPLLSAAIVFLAVSAAWVSVPRPALACSCVPPEPVDAYRGDPLKLIFAGTVATADATGVQVAVERWFQGPSERVVALAPSGFGGQGAACQDPFPPVGSRWIWIAFVPKAGQQPQVNLCTPKARLDTPEGAALLASTEAAFGAGTVVPPIDEPPTPTGGETPLVLLVVGGVGIAALVALGVAGVAAARSGSRP